MADSQFLSYTDRSLDQIVQATLQELAITAPEITDQNPSNPLVRFVYVWAAIAEQIGYYLDNGVREAYVPYVQLYRNIVKLAQAYDYPIAPPQPATVQLQFTFQGDGTAFAGTTIPAGTVVATAAGLQYRTVSAVVVPASALNTVIVVVDAVQQAAQTTVNLGNSDGTASQVFLLPTDFGGVGTVLVNSIAWEQVRSLGFSVDTDEHFLQTVNEDRRVTIEFGDGVAGLIPTLGDAIDLTYSPTAGAAGNVDANSITVLSTPVTVPAGFTLSVTNPSRAVGGVSVEPITLLRKRIPTLIRTQERAVTEQDYIDIPMLQPSVGQAAVGWDCGKTINVYIVPVSGGIATTALVATVQAWVDLRKMLTTNVTVLPAGEVQMRVAATIRVKPNYKRADVLTAVTAALVAGYSTEFQRIGGTIHISDAYQLIENVAGVDSSTITAFVPRPYGRPLIGTSPLIWSVQLLAGSTATHYWQILFTSATTFQLLKDYNFIGSFSVGTPVLQTEVAFTISGSYAIGDTFEFYTYPFAATDIELSEFSIPVVLSADVALVGVGGIV